MKMRVGVENYTFGEGASRIQRAQGALELTLAHDLVTGQTRIAELYQAGCLKVRFPRGQNANVCEAVTLNISGGIAGGDELSTSIELGADACAMVASLAAEKVYGAIVGEEALVSTSITLKAGACMAYLPQETILFDGHHLHRKLRVHMANSAKYLGVESLVFGRAAMGEMVTRGHLRDHIEVVRGGDLLFKDMTRLHGDIAAQLAGKALAGGALAMASVLWIAPDAASDLDAIRAYVRRAPCNAAASAFDGMVLVRLLAGSAAALRKGVAGVLQICLNGGALPRVWQS